MNNIKIIRTSFMCHTWSHEVIEYYALNFKFPDMRLYYRILHVLIKTKTEL